VLVRLAHLGVTNVIALLRLLPDSDRDKDAEILALRYSGWGYRRVHSELLVLGIKVAPSTAWAILREAGIDPAPGRVTTTWADFLHSQANALLAADFIETVTLTGGAAVHPRRDRAHLSPHPTRCASTSSSTTSIDRTKASPTPGPSRRCPNRSPIGTDSPG
jgi:hypothetical protein